MWTRCFLPAIFLFTINSLPAQEYRAINGSLYAGSLATTLNPASIVHLPHVWDITPVAIQLKYTTNSIFIKKASYLSKWKKTTAEVNLNNGNFERYLMANVDLKLLSTRIRLNNNSAFAFDISGRMFLTAKTSTLNGQDTIGNLREFIGINQNNMPLSAIARGNGWMEYNGTYARTVKLFNNAVLNAGVTLKLNRGLAGGYINASDFETAPGMVNNIPGYYLTNGNLDYGYSSNLDGFDTVTSFISGWKSFFKKSKYTLGISLGAEYIVAGSGGEESDYSFKLGISLLDLGKNKFQYSDYSRSAVLNKPNVSDTLIETTFESIYDPASLADSLQSIAGTINTPAATFNLLQPARLIISADKRITENIFIHTDITIPLINITGKNKLFARDINLLNLSVRYETDRFGVYLPASLNTNMNFWMGGAVRAGPLLLGIHNWANIVTKNKIQNGGAYLALIFGFGNKTGNIKGSGCDFGGINEPGMLNRQMKQLNCPTRF